MTTTIHGCQQQEAHVVWLITRHQTGAQDERLGVVVGRGNNLTEVTQVVAGMAIPRGHYLRIYECRCTEHVEWWAPNMSTRTELKLAEHRSHCPECVASLGNCPTAAALQRIVDTEKQHIQEASR